LFHGLTKKADDPSTVYKRIDSEFHDDLNKCAEIGLHRKLVNRIVNFFESKKDIALNGSHKIVAHHCDFGPYNVFISSDIVTVIDFEGRMDGIIYDDVCYFLSMVDTIPSYHLNRRMRIRIRESFLEGYSKYEEVDQDEFRFFMVINIVKIMSRNPVFRKSANTWLSGLSSYQKFNIFASRFEEQLFDKKIV
jgi:thiamine kinase-like enzyme